MKSMLLSLVLALCVSNVARAGEGRGRPPAVEAAKLTVADVLKALGLDESKLRGSDEPPGKLRALEGEVTLERPALLHRCKTDVW